MQEYSYLVRATDTLSEDHWFYVNMISATVQCFHSLGFLRLFSIYLHYEKEVTYLDFFSGLLDFILVSAGQTRSAFFRKQPDSHEQSVFCLKGKRRPLLFAWFRTYGLPVTVSRCSNNYGSYQHPEKLIPLMITNALADQPLPVYGSGLNVRDWIYVKDHCRAVDVILRKGIPGKVYNVGGHSEVRNIDIVRLICEKLNKPEALISYVPDRKGHDLRYAIDASRIGKELGWNATVPFMNGLEKTIEWYVDNAAWWMPLKNER